MVRWLMENGCPRGQLAREDVVNLWPARTAADSRRLAEARWLMGV